MTGCVIKDILREKGIKQKWLAEQLQISPDTLSHMLKRDLKVCELTNICEILKIPVDKLLVNKKEGTVNPTKNPSTFPNEI